MLEMLPITIIVHTKNSGATLAACLASLPMVNELLVVDMQSTDQTLTIAREFHARTISVADLDYVEPARNIAIEAATQPWILIIDADETLPKTAHEWLPELLEKQEHTVYALPRKNIVFNRAYQHAGWWPDYQVRLFRKGDVTWSDKIHAQPTCAKKPHRLPATDVYALIHLNYQHIAQFVERMNRYTTIEARTKSDTQDERWLSQLTDEFFSRWGALEGWREEEHGLAISLLQAYYPLLTALKRWEADGFKHQSNFAPKLSQQLSDLQRNLAYWHATYQLEQRSGLHRLYWQIRRKLQL